MTALDESLARTSPAGSVDPDLITPIDEFLRRQSELTPVERFADAHTAGLLPAGQRWWGDRLPVEPPGPGQQYGFAVDLDACTGCKSCVAACNNLNGLEEGETWRRTGTLHGTGVAGPQVQTVTTACHHCVEPACLEGCPAEAYEKDPITGIVRHLDDSCIGCQYCTLTCPYDVPDFRPSLGIVRKCDMCTGRLENGEAPACVQACPTGAITISVVDVDAVRVDAVGDAALVAGAPRSSRTLPTTTYLRDGEAVGPEHFEDVTRPVRPAHAHPPLVAMLVLTQVAVGTYIADLALRGVGGSGSSLAVDLVALVTGLVALSASILHLGRPLLAWRAILGLRHSWLSREIVAFSAFAGAAVLDAGLGLTGLLPGIRPLVGAAVVVCGIAGVGCSVLVYSVTRRAWWSTGRTSVRFAATTVGGGALVAGAGRLALDSTQSPAAVARMAASMAAVALVASVVASRGFLPRSGAPGTRSGELSATRLLLSATLSDPWRLRIGLGVISVAAAFLTAASVDNAGLGAALALAFAASVAIVAELVERHLFFVASAPSGMPGEPA